MNSKTKIGAGLSVSAILVLIFHFFHVLHAVNMIGEQDKKELLKNTPVYFIQTDTAGKKDTIRMEDYLKKAK